MKEKIKIIKESWNFGGFTQGNDGWPQEYLSSSTFRVTEIIEGESSWKPSVNNVNRLGWPVHNYKWEEISEKEKQNLTKSADWDDFYKCFRVKNHD